MTLGDRLGRKKKIRHCHSFSSSSFNKLIISQKAARTMVLQKAPDARRAKTRRGGRV